MGPLTTTAPSTATQQTVLTANTGIVPPHMTAPPPPPPPAGGPGIFKPLTTGPLSILAQQQAAEEAMITQDEAEAAIQTPQMTASRKPLIIGGIVVAAVLGVYLITRSK